jgi:Lectin C-type domain
MRLTLVAISLVCATAACSSLSGLEDFTLAEGAGGSTAGGGGTMSSGGGDGAAGGAGAGVGGSGGMAGAGGQGGPPPPPMCGNGIIEQGEQCDAAGQTAYCSENCAVTGCDGEHDHLHPVTGHCYRYSDADGQIGSWPPANSFCSNWNGELLVINSPAEHDFIIALSNTLAFGNEYLWVGARDQDGDGEYHWIDGVPLSSSSPMWESPPAANGCVAINPVQGGLAASGNCVGTDLPTFHLHFACERAPEGQPLGG